MKETSNDHNNNKSNKLNQTSNANHYQNNHKTNKNPSSESVYNAPQNIFHLPPRSSSILALMFIWLINFKRTLALLIFQFVMPALQVVLFCVAIGKDPKHLSVAVQQGDMEHFPQGNQLYLLTLYVI